MKTTILSAFFCLCVTGFSDIIFDIDYELPAYTNGQQLNGGLTISDSINGFTSQALLIHDGGGGGIDYYATEPFTSGIHNVSWDFTIPDITQGAEEIINAHLSSPSESIQFAIRIGGNSSGIELYYGPRYPEQPHITLNLNQSYAFQVVMNLDSDYYSFWLDRVLLEDSVNIPSDATLGLVDFGQDQTLGLQGGLDNFRWEVIPEPTSLLLILCGASAICFARRRKQTG